MFVCSLQLFKDTIRCLGDLYRKTTQAELLAVLAQALRKLAADPHALQDDAKLLNQELVAELVQQLNVYAATVTQ